MGILSPLKKLQLRASARSHKLHFCATVHFRTYSQPSSLFALSPKNTTLLFYHRNRRQYHPQAAWVDPPCAQVCKALADSRLLSWGGNGSQASRGQWNQSSDGLHEEEGGEAGHVPEKGGSTASSEGWKLSRGGALKALCSKVNSSRTGLMNACLRKNIEINLMSRSTKTTKLAKSHSGTLFLGSSYHYHFKI